MSGETLKPCPFCGGEATHDTYQEESLWSHAIVTKDQVGCMECDIWLRSEPGYEVEAITAWNTRPTPTVEVGDDLTATYMLGKYDGRKEAADAIASRDAEIERLRGELRRAHLKRLVELSEEFGGYDELSTSALSALKTAREG